MLERTLLGLALSFFVGGMGYWRHSLSASGWLGAVAVGTLAMAASWAWGLLIIVFFVLSSALSKLGKGRKLAVAEDKFSKTDRRDLGQVLGGLPEGPISSRPGVKSVGQVRVPKVEGYARVEGARGELGCYLVADGGPKPYRLKWRGASFCNLAVLPHIIPGHKVADVVAIMGSVDPVFGEVDR